MFRNIGETVDMSLETKRLQLKQILSKEHLENLENLLKESQFRKMDESIHNDFVQRLQRLKNTAEWEADKPIVLGKTYAGLTKKGGTLMVDVGRLHMDLDSLPMTPDIATGAKRQFLQAYQDTLHRRIAIEPIREKTYQYRNPTINPAEQRASESFRMQLVLVCIAIGVFTTIRAALDKKQRISLMSLAWFGLAALIARPDLLSGTPRQFARKAQFLRNNQFNDVLSRNGIGGKAHAATARRIMTMDRGSSARILKITREKSRKKESLKEEDFKGFPKNVAKTLSKMSPDDATLYVMYHGKASGGGSVGQALRTATEEYIEHRWGAGEFAKLPPPDEAIEKSSP